MCLYFAKSVNHILIPLAVHKRPLVFGPFSVRRMHKTTTGKDLVFLCSKWIFGFQSHFSCCESKSFCQKSNFELKM